MSLPRTAMVLAAGLGTRMRPLTDDRPKALVEVAGRPLIDHMLDRLEQAGVTRTRPPALVISDERARLLETGGGLKLAGPLLGEAPIFTANIDAVWIEHGRPALQALGEAFDPERMDACLLVTRTDLALGLDGPGDFFRHADGRLSFRDAAAAAPYTYCGVQVFKPELATREPDAAFSTSRIWRRLAADGRLYGVELDGRWIHVGDPGAVLQAEASLQAWSRLRT